MNDGGNGAACIHILHFNDVYDLDAAARFATVLQMERDAAAKEGASPPLLLFSGDALGPSVAGSMTRGQHMLDLFRLIGVSHACIGNHEVRTDFSILRYHMSPHAPHATA